MISKCPGSQSFSQPHPEYMNCNYCGAEIEIWTDEAKAECPKCKKTSIRLGGQSCLDWCKYAKDCVGGEIYSKYMQNKIIGLKQKLIEEMEGHFGQDAKRIRHAKNVMGFTEEILKSEKADWHIVIPASILHDTGIKVAEEKYGSSAGKYQEKESPGIAKKILLKEGFKKEDIDEICDIIAHHHSPGKVDTQNFKVLYDADRLVNLRDEVDVKDKEKVRKIIDKIFLTNTGRELAQRIYL